MIAATQRAKEAPTTEFDHLIASFEGDPAGPTLVTVGSLHGNEPAGALALEEIADRLRVLPQAAIKGRIFLVAGNMRALEKRVRYLDGDLNRAWTHPNLSNVGTPTLLGSEEGRELTELDRLFDSILITAQNEVYVVDLHSTSAGGPAFATVGDTIRNRRFARKFPVTTLLGVEEQLDGTMLEYLNNAGAVTLGFEGGKHGSPRTVENHIAFTILALAYSGIVAESDIPDFDEHYLRLASSTGDSHFFEVVYREPVTPEDDFRMNSGFTNFDRVIKGQPLAQKRSGVVRSPLKGIILMPLYQRLGEDGFFIGRHVAAFWLSLSFLLRRLNVQKLMPWLPGVARDPNDPSVLVVNTRIARLFPLQIFHLLGYRKRRWSGGDLIVSRRRHDVESPFLRKSDG